MICSCNRRRGCLAGRRLQYADLDQSNKLLRKAKKVAAAGKDDYDKQIAQTVNQNM